MTVPHTDEGTITDVEYLGAGYYRVHLDNGNMYKTSYLCDDVTNPAYRGVTVRLLLTEAHRVWDISAI